MVDLRKTLRDFAYLYTLTIIAWAVFLAGWTIIRQKTINIDTFAEQWFMLVIIAFVMIIPTFIYRYSKENLNNK